MSQLPLNKLSYSKALFHFFPSSLHTAAFASKAKSSGSPPPTKSRHFHPLIGQFPTVFILLFHSFSSFIHVDLMLLRRHVPFHSHIPRNRSIIWKLPIREKSSGGSRPKKKAYHRVPELDRVMELNKKPSMILELNSIIQSQKTNSLLLRDLEKNVGFVRKWAFMGLIQKYPTIFRVSSGPHGPPSVSLTDKAMKVALEEAHARTLMEPILVNNLRKLLMLCVDCKVPLETLEFVGPELGLPCDFRESVIAKYPQFFSVKKQVNGRDLLVLEDWDSSLAVTAREARLAQEGVVLGLKNPRKVKISRDGNYMGPYAFKVNFPAGFRPNVGYLEELERWQKLDFPSPYLNARRLDDATDPVRARKRAVGVIHELLSLTIKKRMTSAQLDVFHAECLLPSKLLLCLIKHHGIFYLTNKGVRSTVFLKDAYLGSNLIDKCSLLQFYDKFLALCGRGNVDLSV